MRTRELERCELMDGKRIKKAVFIGIIDDDGSACDDRPFLDITFEDGTSVRVSASYGSCTDESVGEYPVFVRVERKTEDQKIERWL